MAINTYKNKGYQMKKSILGLLGTLAMTTALFADIPYTFTPYTPAKASEVNANFQALSDQLTTLEGTVSSIGGSTTTESDDCWKAPFTYTYQYIPSNIGDTITVGGVEYIMVAMPFIEYSTGDHYYLKKPVKKTSSSNYNLSLTTSITTYYQVDGTECYTDTFLGFPAQVDDGISYYTNYSGRVTEPTQSYDDFTTTANLYFNKVIKINQTRFSVNMNLNKKLQETPHITADVDFRDEVDWSVLGLDYALVDNLRTLMNYVEIVKIP